MQLPNFAEFHFKQTLSLSGALDAKSMDNIRQSIEALTMSEAEEITIDLSSVNKLDASGVGALVYLFKRLRNSNRTLKIIGAHGQPEAVIRLLRLEKTIDTQFMI